MSNIHKILLFTACTILWAEMLPENGAQLNYTQVFFSWDQIPNVTNYQLTITNMGSEGEEIFNTIENSALLTDNDFLDWNSTYTWFNCGYFGDGSAPFCSEIYSFEINPLPDYFPDVINVLSFDESLSQEGITVMDFESLNFSGSLDQNGNPVWFVDKNNFQERFVFTQFLNNGNMTGFGPGKGYEIDVTGL